jgi:hypothetical protein
MDPGTILRTYGAGRGHKERGQGSGGSPATERGTGTQHAEGSERDLTAEDADPPASPEGGADGGQAQTKADGSLWTQVVYGNTQITIDFVNRRGRRG